MKRQGILIRSAVIAILLSVNCTIYAQTNEEQREDTSGIATYSETGQQDSLMQQSVTISEADTTRTSKSTSANYKPTEAIRIYSGRHEGNNIIRTIEVPLPENSVSNREAYIPH